tara:strand:- start:84 stop:311 length:228 start_codon:yes stop_codon:yes gene_type:complete
MNTTNLKQQPENDMVTIKISKKLLTKLRWALPAGTDEDRVKFVIKEAIEQGEKEEGVSYPDDREPGHDFDGFTLK